MTLSTVSLITGFSVGLEFIGEIPEEDIDNSVILDLAFFRFIFTVGKNS